ncbi:hypothetical protein COOONC_18027, partial [Cooperia oncophora]
EDSAKYEEYCTAINLITGGIKIIKSSQENLQTLVDKLEKAYEESKSKGNKKDLVSEIEEIDQYCQFSEKIAGANDIIFVLQARINEYRDKVHKLALKLGIDRQKSQLTATNKHIENKQKGSDSQESIDTELALWLSDDASDSSFDREDVACRTLKPKQADVTVEDVMQEIEKEITAKRFVDSRLKNRSKFEETKKKEFQPKDDIKKPIKSCVFCNQVNHPTAYCRNTDVQAKRRIVSERKLCWKCFSTNHNSFSCSLSNVPQCGDKHHTQKLWHLGLA